MLLGEGVTVGLDEELDLAAVQEREKMKAQFRPEDLAQYAVKGECGCGLLVHQLEAQGCAGMQDRTRVGKQGWCTCAGVVQDELSCHAAMLTACSVSCMCVLAVCLQPPNLHR